MTEIAWKPNKREKKSSDLDLLNLATNCTVITKQKHSANSYSLVIISTEYLSLHYYNLCVFMVSVLDFLIGPVRLYVVSTLARSKIDKEKKRPFFGLDWQSAQILHQAILRKAKLLRKTQTCTDKFPIVSFCCHVVQSASCHIAVAPATCNQAFQMFNALW